METVILVLIIVLTVLVLAVAAAVFLIFRKRREANGGLPVAVLQERISGYETEVVRLKEELANRDAMAGELKNMIEARDRDISLLKQDLAVVETELKNERDMGEEKLRTLKGAKEELTNQFKVLADSILKDNSRHFKEQNAEGMGEILKPLKERLQDFQKTIKENYDDEGRERRSLRDEVRRLAEMNAKLSAEASNLTNALKGESKTQGNWGEMILERILEVSGLRKGEEYTVQESHSQEDGSRVQPDVVIHLPEDRHMVIDSKVSLNAYDEYMNAEDEEQAADALKGHISSVRNHMKGLSSKEYQKLHDEKSPDFVIMFIPIEPAFMLAISEDGKLWEDAWKNNILLVSSSTLLFVMRIVMQLWRQEHRSRNSLEIAQRGAALYEKIAGFVGDFEDIGKRLELSRKSFENARGKLTTGRGNVIRQAEMLKELGITSGKQLPEEYVETARAEDGSFLDFHE